MLVCILNVPAPAADVPEGVVTGTLAAVEGADLAAVTGTVTPLAPEGVVTGTLAATEGADLAEFAASVSVLTLGIMAAVEGADTASFAGTAGPAAPAGTTLDPANKDPDSTLSNGNLSTTRNSGIAYSGTKSTTTKASGKVYLEWRVDQRTTYDQYLSILVGAAPLNAPGGTSTAIYMHANGGVTGPSTTNGAVGGQLLTTIWGGVAIDFDAKLVWFRVNPTGQWNAGGTADPATGVGGYSFATLTGPFFIQAGVSWTSDKMTMNFGATTFAGTVPTGFTAWT